MPEGVDEVVLLDEQKYSIDSAGRITTTLRKVVRVLTADGVEEWSSVEQEYAPWHEKRPELRARVLTADGADHWLDSKTVTDAPAVEFDASIFSDSRRLRAPLPAVAADTLVEFEIVVRESAPVLAAGSVRRVNIWDSIAVQRVHVIVDAAAGVPLRTSSQLVPSDAIQRVESKSGVHIECDWGPIEAKKDREYSLPFDVADHPVFEFSTGRSWTEVASAYGAIVDSRIAATKASGLGEPPKSGENAKAIAARLVAALHKQVRYTGLELGDAAIVPGTPAEVIARRYGDCKDKATLLVAALREAGLKAHVALLLPGTRLDLNPELPGFGLFSHAIVYVDTPEALWIDATAEYARVGDLPAADQGRLALIATADTKALVKTPESSSADNRSVHTVEIRLADYGRAEIRRSIEALGEAESDMRRQFGDPGKVKETLEGQVKLIYLADGVADFTATRRDDFSQPFRLTFIANNAGRGVTEEDQAVAGLFTHFVFSDLPFGLTPNDEDNADKKDAKPRTHDFVLPQAHQSEHRYRVYYPSFLKPTPLPKSEEVKLGPATFSRSYRQDASGYVEAVYRFDSGKRRYTPAEYAEFRKEVRRVWSAKPEVLSFPSATSEALALGKVQEAIGIAREYSEKHPDSVSAQARLSRVMIAAGAGDSALATAKRAVELDGRSTQAWQALGWAYQHDSFGRRFRGNWNAAEAEKAYKQAIETAADKLVPQTDLAILYEHNASGDRYGKGSRLDDAIKTYRAALAERPNQAVQQNLIIALMRAGKYEEGEAELKKAPGGGLETALTSLSQGADRAILDAQRSYSDPATRASVLLGAAVNLGMMRRYELAVELLKAAKRISNAPELDVRLNAVSRMKRFDQVQYPPDDPRSVVLRFYLAVSGGELDPQQLRPLVTKREKLGDEAMADKSLRRVLAGLRGQFRTVGLSGDSILDVIASLVELEKVGDDEFGYWIKGGAAATPMPATYVAKEDGQYRILATAASLENVGKVVLERVAAGDLATAKRWLDLVISGSVAVKGDAKMQVFLTGMDSGPNGDDSPAAKLLWSGLTEQGRTVAAIRTAAASLIGAFSVSEEAIGILKQARQAATNRTDRGNIDLALCQAYAKAGKWAELLASAKDLSASYAVADKSFSYVAKARFGLKQWQELEQDARAALAKSPENPQALRAAALAMMRAGKLDRAAEYVDRLGKLTFAGKEEHNLQAWYGILMGKVDERLNALLEKDQETDKISPDLAYLVGLLQAVSGKPEEAQRSLAAALDVDDWAGLDARAWVLQGRIQDAYGNADSAKVAYAEARKTPVGGDEAEWALRLIPGEAKQ